MRNRRKKLAVFTTVIMLVVMLVPGCKKTEPVNNASGTSISPTEAIQTPTVSEQITEAPAVTADPTATPVPDETEGTGSAEDTKAAESQGEADDTRTGTEDGTEGEAETGADNGNEGETETGTDNITEDEADGQNGTAVVIEYSDILGTWYQYSSEIEGDYYLASEVNEFCTVTFNEDYTADTYSIFYYGPGEASDPWEYSGPVRELEGDSWFGRWTVDFGVESCTYYYSVDEDGNLVQKCHILYDEGLAEAVSVVIFTREPSVFEPEPLVVPEAIQQLMDGAAENYWITVIVNPDPELSAACDEAGWVLHDESSNEWLDNPITNPVELIVCNSSTRYVELEIHEPRSDFDPTQSATEWVPGPFMYWECLNPGEIARFIVNMVDDPHDATMALYMSFEGDGLPYYNRIYNYEYSYFSFN